MASPETKICKGALVKGLQEGNIKFGFGCMVHPYANIITEGGSSIIFGDYNIIEEGVMIKACPKVNGKTGKEEPTQMFIGNYNHFKVGAHVENTSVQDFNVIDYKLGAQVPQKGAGACLHARSPVPLALPRLPVRALPCHHVPGGQPASAGPRPGA